MTQKNDIQIKEIQVIRDELLTEVFKKHDVFFAFSEKQVEEQKVEGVEYLYSRSLGMFYNKKSKDTIYKDMEEAIDKAIAIDKETNSKESIILRELLNYECFYTGSPIDAIDKLKDYDYTKEEVIEVFNSNFNRVVEEQNR